MTATLSTRCGGQEKRNQKLGGMIHALVCAFLAVLLLSTAASAGNASGIISEDYDSYSQGFVTVYKENYSIIADVPNGMIAASAVSLYCGEGNISAVYRNGESFEPETANERLVFNQSGAYTLVISDQLGGGLPSRVFTFRILDEDCADINVLVVPENITVLELTRNDEVLDLEDAVRNGMIDLRAEGSYTLRCQMGDFEWDLAFDKATQPPLLTVEEDEEEHSANLFFADGLDHIKVFLNGSLVYFAENGAWDEENGVWVLTDMEGAPQNVLTLSEPGTYDVLAYDEGGEAVLESLVIEKKPDMAGFFAILILAAVTVFLWIYFLREKRARSEVR